HPVRGRASVFLAIPPQRTVLFSGSFLLSLAVPPSQGRRSRWTGSIWVLLERNPPKRPLVPGGALPLGRESNPAPHKKGTICHQNTLREKKNAAAASNQPVKTFRLGRIKAAVWENEGEQKFYSVTFARTYVDEANKYHDTDSFGRDDLPLVAKLADQVLSRKLFANVNSLFANESKVVTLGRHLACQRGTGKGHDCLAQVHSRLDQPLAGTAVHRGLLCWYGRIRYRGSGRQL